MCVTIYQLILIVKSVINFRVAFGREYGEFFFATQMVEIVGDMVPPDFLTDNGPQTYQRYIQVTKCLLQSPNIPSTVEDIDGKETGSGAMGISHLKERTVLNQIKGLLLVRAASKYI